MKFVIEVKDKETLEGSLFFNQGTQGRVDKRFVCIDPESFVPRGLSGDELDLPTAQSQDSGDKTNELVVGGAFNRWGGDANFEIAIVLAENFGFSSARLDVNF